MVGGRVGEWEGEEGGLRRGGVIFQFDDCVYEIHPRIADMYIHVHRGTPLLHIMCCWHTLQ